MFGKKKSAPELAKNQTGELGDVLSRQMSEWADLLGSRAGGVSKQATRAGKQAKRYADQGMKWATPKIENASRRAQDLSHNATDMWEHEYLPRLQAVADAAREEAGKGGDLRNRALAVSAASTKAYKNPPKSENKRGHKLGWLLVAASTAGIGYFIWKRSQPIEDPWAEAYWEDIAADDSAARTQGSPTNVHAKAEEASMNPDQATPLSPPPASVVSEDTDATLANSVAQGNAGVEGEKVDKPPMSEAEAAAQAGLAESDRKSDLGKPDNR